MDFIEGLPNSSGFSVIMVVVDRFTKYSHFYPLKCPYTAASVAVTFLNQVVKLHGLPKSIVSDRDKVFTSNFWKALFGLLDIKLSMSSAYHPQIDCQTERVNQCLEMYLRCAVSSTPKQWSKWLSLAELWYNSSYHTSLKCSPFKALWVDPSMGAVPDPMATDNSEVSVTLTKRKHFTDLLKDHLARAQNRMNLEADTKRSSRQFQVGESVLLKLQMYVQSLIVIRPCPKLALKYFGPYKIIKRIGTVTYKLELPSTSQVHPVSHVSQLKPFTPDHTPVF
jgi:hypothetical protein